MLVALVDQGPITALLMLGVVILVQQLEGHILQPFLMGRWVSLHPLGVIVAIGVRRARRPASPARWSPYRSPPRSTPWSSTWPPTPTPGDDPVEELEEDYDETGRRRRPRSPTVRGPRRTD